MWHHYTTVPSNVTSPHKEVIPRLEGSILFGSYVQAFGQAKDHLASINHYIA